MVSFLRLGSCIVILLFCKVYADGSNNVTTESNLEKTRYEVYDGRHTQRNRSRGNANHRNQDVIVGLKSSLENNRFDLCLPRYTCNASLPENTTRLCNCDEKCLRYKDCCSDSKYYNEDEMSKPSSYVCQEVMYDNLNYSHVFIKITCSPDWKDTNISNKCNEGALSSKLYANIPATGSKSKITYRNMFCALCNFEKLEEIDIWMNMTLVSDCNLQPGTNATLGTLNRTMSLNNTNDIDKALEFDGLGWYFKYNGGTYNCEFGEVYIPIDLRSTLDGCSSVVPRENSESCLNEDYKKECDSTFGLANNEDFKFYRNKYCYFCENNSTDTENLFCPEDKSLSRVLSINPRSQLRIYEGRGFPVLFLGSNFMKRNSSSNSTSIGYVQGKKSETEKLFAWYTTISLIISSLFLFVHLVVYAISKKSESIGKKNLASFCLALLLANFSFLVGNYINGSSCLVISSLTYYFFLVSFTWLFTITYDLTRMVWRSTKKYRISHNRRTFFVIYTIGNWCICLLPTFTLVYLDLYRSDNPFAPHFNFPDVGEGCWFHNQSSLFYFFALPVSLIVIVNFLLFSYTSYLICTNKFKSVNEDKDMIAKYMLYVRLALLCGLTWLSVFFAIYLESVFLWFVFMVLNTGQGVFIFVAFTWRSRSNEPVTRVTATS